MAQVIEVIILNTTRGRGVEGDPVRQVTQLWSLDGHFICEQDDYDKAEGPRVPQLQFLLP